MKALTQGENMPKQFTFYPYNPELKQKAKALRRQSTKGEIILWNLLKSGIMMGYDFHRQKPLFNYIVDFFCPRLSLAIEIDGGSHIGKEKYDEERQTFLESVGIFVLRFSEYEVRHDIKNVLYKIEGFIHEHEIANTSPPSSRRDSIGSSPLERG